MIDLKAGDISFKIASGWEDLTVEQVEQLKIKDGKDIDKLRILTTLTDKKMSMIDLNGLIPYLDFIDKPLIDFTEPLNEIVINNKILTLKEDLGVYTYGQKILSTEAIKAGDFLEAIAVYLEPLISDEDFNHKKIDSVKQMLLPLNAVTVYSVFKFISNQLLKLVERDKTLAQEPTYEQQKAGIKNFNQLGEFNTYDMLALGQPWRYNDILALDYNTIFNKLLKNKISSNFETKYSEIMRAK